METVIISIVTAAITALLTTLIKSYIDRLNYKNKLQKDLEFEQQRAVKTTISNYKGHLIDTIGTLHNRLKFLARKEGYAKLSKGKVEKDDQILKSTIYRFLSSFAWMHLIKKEIIHFDPTKAHEEDLVMMKFLRILPLPFQDEDLESNMSRTFNKKSLIQSNIFEEMYKWMIKEKQIISYSIFLQEFDDNLHLFESLQEYLINLKPETESTRWDRLFTFHLLIMCFLNRFGYDFQHNSEANMKKYIMRQGQYEMFKNIDKHLIQKFKLNKVEEVKNMLKIAYSFM